MKRKNTLKLLILTLFLGVGFVGKSQTQANFFVSFTDAADSTSTASLIEGGAPSITGGHLLWTTPDVRHDYEYGFADSHGNLSLFLNPTEDVYFAAKFIGEVPANINTSDFEFFFDNLSDTPSNNGGTEVGTTYSQKDIVASTYTTTVGENDVIYFELGAQGNVLWDEWISLGTDIDLFSHRIECKILGPADFTLQLDWVGTFTTVADIEAMANADDDGSGDTDEVAGADATLSDLTFDGITMPGFTSGQTTYDIVLAEGTTAVPTIAGTLTDGSATIDLTTQASDVTGTATIDITAANGITTSTYTVNFSVYVPTTDESLLLSMSDETQNADINLESGTPTFSEDGVMQASAYEESTGIYRQDFQYGFVDGTNETFIVNPLRDKYFAVKFIGDRPTGFALDDTPLDFFLDLAGGTAISTDYVLENIASGDQNAGSYITASGNEVIYLDLAGLNAVWDAYTLDAENGVGVDGDPESTYDVWSNRVELKFRDAIAETFDWNIDFVGFFETVTDIEAAANSKDDGEGDLHDDIVNTTLSDLTVDGVTIAGFNEELTDYAVILDVGTTVIPTVAASALQEGSTVSVTQATVLPGDATIVVTAPDLTTTETYTVNFSVEVPGENARLSDLTVDEVTVDGFSETIYSYDVVLPVGTVDIPTIAGTLSSELATITTVTQASGLPGSATILVTAENGATTETYTVNFTVIANDDATLSDLTVDGTTVTGFDAGTISYSVELVAGTTTVPAVAGILTDANASAVTTQATELPGSATVVVTAEDGVATTTYTINFTVGVAIPSDDATLSDLAVDGTTVTGFSASTTTYNVELAIGTTTVPTIAETLTDANATAVTTQATGLPGSATVVVTAEDGTTTETYTINFTVEEEEPEEVLGVDELSTQPVYSFLNQTLSVEFAQETKVLGYAVFDASGKTFSSSNNISSLKTLNIPIKRSGISIIKVVTSDGVYTSKFRF